MKHTKPAVLIVVLFIISLTLVVAHAAYRGHSELDSDVLISAQPELRDTVLDGCSTCHRGGDVAVPGEPDKRVRHAGTCDYCHSEFVHGNADIRETLTPFGVDYLDAGRNTDAFRAIAARDSDGDGFTNAEEFAAHTNPGDSNETLDSAPAPSRILSLYDLTKLKLPLLTQTIFMNVTKSKEGDSYSTYRGFLLLDVLKAAGMGESTTSVDVISIDGYEKTFTPEQLSRAYKQAAPVLGLDKVTLGECGWVRYTADGLSPDKPLPDANVLLAMERDGNACEPAHIDPETGKLRGDGPFRTIAPQMINPGPPDLSEFADPACNGKVPALYHYQADGYEKNSDYCVKAVVAIRVNPLPKGMRDIPWRQNAQAYIDKGQLIIFGNLKAGF